MHMLTEAEKRKNILNTIKKIFESDYDDELYERFYDGFMEEIQTDDESITHVVRDMLKAYRDNDADGMLIAICGWSMESLMKKARLIDDEDGMFNEPGTKACFDTEDIAEEA
jgi:hypothetical protein